MVRTKEGGSVLSFVVIGIVLVALLIGGVFFARHQTAQPVPERQQPKQDTPSPQPQPSNNQDQAGQKKDESGSSSNKSESKPSDETAQGNSGTTGELPQTGPGLQLIGSLLIVGLVSGVAVSYARSRRPELSL